MKKTRKPATSTQRAQKRTARDDAWAKRISAGRYSTLRKLMTAIHQGHFDLVPIK